MKKDEVKHISELSRIELSSEEERGLESDFKKIISYIDKIKVVSESIDAATDTTVGEVRNVSRIDEPGDVFRTESLTRLFPKERDGYLAVKKVLEQ